MTNLKKDKFPLLDENCMQVGNVIMTLQKCSNCQKCIGAPLAMCLTGSMCVNCKLGSLHDYGMYATLSTAVNLPNIQTNCFQCHS